MSVADIFRSSSCCLWLSVEIKEENIKWIPGVMRGFFCILTHCWYLLCVYEIETYTHSGTVSMAFCTHLLSGLAQRSLFFIVLKLYEEKLRHYYKITASISVCIYLVKYVLLKQLFFLTLLPWCCSNLCPPGFCRISGISLGLDFHNTVCSKKDLKKKKT